MHHEAMAFARIEEEILRQKLVLSNLHTQRNHFSLVFRLPDEILATIFIYCARDWYYNQRSDIIQPRWVKVSYVCRLWRNVALNCLSLWSLIPAMSQRWIEEFLSRSQKVSLKIHTGGCRAEVFRSSLGKVLDHVERIQELAIHFPYTSQLPHQHAINKALSKLSARAPFLRCLTISAKRFSPEMSAVLFDGYTPALRTLELFSCPTAWYSLKLNGLTTLNLRHVPAPFQQNTEEFLATLACMQDLTHLSLIHSLASSQAFISTVAFDTFQKISLPHLSCLQIVAPHSTVIVFLSCVNVMWNVKVRLACVCTQNSSTDNYASLLSILARRLSIYENQAPPSPKIQSLIIRSTGQDPELTFSTLERDFNFYYVSESNESDHSLPLQICFTDPEVDKDWIMGIICSSLPLPHVQSVRAITPPISSAFWKPVLGHLDSLQYLKLSQGDMPELAPILRVTPQDCMEKDGHADGACHQKFAPVLEELELSRITFPPDPDGVDALGSDLQSLENTPSTRKDPQVRLTTIDISIPLIPSQMTRIIIEPRNILEYVDRAGER